MSFQIHQENYISISNSDTNKTLADYLKQFSGLNKYY